MYTLDDRFESVLTCSTRSVALFVFRHDLIAIFGVPLIVRCRTHSPQAHDKKTARHLSICPETPPRQITGIMSLKSSHRRHTRSTASQLLLGFAFLLLENHLHPMKTFRFRFQFVGRTIAHQHIKDTLLLLEGARTICRSEVEVSRN